MAPITVNSAFCTHRKSPKMNRGENQFCSFFSISKCQYSIIYLFILGGKGVGSLRCIVFSLNLYSSPALLFLLNRASSPDLDARLPRVRPLEPGSRTSHRPSSIGKANSRREGPSGGSDLKAGEPGSTARTPSTRG